MKRTTTEPPEAAGHKKSKAQSSLEETLQGSTRRFSAFAELGIPTINHEVEGVKLDDDADAVTETVLEPAPIPSTPAFVVDEEALELEDVLCELPLDAIVPNPQQPRFLENLEANQRLLQSIKNSGVIQPILVRKISGSENFELIAGERRWRACKEIGKSTIPAIIRKADSNQSAAESLIENLVREDLSPLEEARAYQRLLDEHEFSRSDIADRTGVTTARISQLLKLLSLPSDIQDLLYNSGVSVSSTHGELLATINNEPGRQRKLALRVIKEQLNREDLKKQLAAKPRNNKGFEPVQFVDRGDKGYNLTVRFHSNRRQDLPEIEEKLTQALNRVRILRSEENSSSSSL
ncbi:ParB/RepB/Spo0J family partition protein [uncultured Nitrospira sp.]|uniref:ParB/RepB/Spo0J family partition protein n=1 Tax=uncultured Nitrospira sp. TaxID=157176 RepID=UPI0031407C14